jgi:hypothetical protein
MNNADSLITISSAVAFPHATLPKIVDVMGSLLSLISAAQAGIEAASRLLSFMVIIFTLICSLMRLPAFSTHPNTNSKRI